jgi:hypothetical protein
MPKKILLSIFIFTLSLGFSQTNFHHSYGGGGRDIAYSTCETEDNGIMILGLTTSFGSGKDLYLIKLDHEGNILWSRTYGGKKVDSGIKIKHTSDGNFIIIGNTTSFEAKRRDVYLLKIDPNGEEIWSYAYGGELNEFGLDVAETPDGGYIIVGETNSFDVVDHDIYVEKVDKNGGKQWSRTIGGDSLEFASSVIVVEGGYILGGETNSVGAGGYDAMMIKIDTTGEVMWSKVFGGPQDDHLNELIEDDYGHVAFVGSTTSFGYGGRDILFVVASEEDGHPYKIKSLGFIGDEEPQVIRKVGTDGYLIVGFSNSFNDQLTMQDAYMIRMTKRFKMRWSKTFGGYLNDLGFGVVTHSHGNFVIVGESTSYSDAEDKDIFAISIEDSRKIKTCELTNVQTVRMPIHKFISVNNMFFEDTKVESHQINAQTAHKTVETQSLVICEADKLLIESNTVEEEIVE